MVVQAYILIQTEVGKAASVAEAIAGIAGVVLAEDVTGPYDVIARVEANTVDELGKLVIAKIQDVAGHHPHPDLHRRPRLSTSLARRRARAARHALPHAGHRPPRPRGGRWPACAVLRRRARAARRRGARASRRQLGWPRTVGGQTRASSTVAAGAAASPPGATPP